MRFAIAMLLACLSGSTHAAPQFSQAECQKLNAQRLEVRRQLRQPYHAEHGMQLQRQQQELERLLKHHCKKPLKNPPPVLQQTPG